MKGLLKGLRYLSQIFENEKEEEIQIGLPTDVKHVAHIGMDGPSANTPSWMNKYSPSSETTPTTQKDVVTRNIKASHKSSSSALDSPTQRSSSKTRHTRRNHSSSSSAGSADGDSFNLSKHRRHKHSTDTGSPISERSRRHKHSGDIGSPTSEQTRRHKHSGDMGSPTSERTRRMQIQNTGSDSPLENPPRIPKSRRKRSKGSSGSGSTRSSRSKDPDPFPESSPFSDPGLGFENNEVRSYTISDKGNACEEISRGIRAL